MYARKSAATIQDIEKLKAVWVAHSHLKHVSTAASKK